MFKTATVGTGFKRLGELLIEDGVITKEQLAFCLSIQKGTTQRIGEIIVNQGYATEKDVYQYLAKQNRLQFYDKKLSPRIIHREIFLQLKQKAYEKVFLPVNYEDNLCFLITDPLDSELFEIAEKYNAEILLATQTSVLTLLELLQLQEDSLEKVAESATKDISEGEIRRFVHYILSRAIAEDASDIHIEPGLSTTNIRFRIDSQLVSVISLPIIRHENILYIIAHEAQKDPSEAPFKRLDGSFVFRYAGGKAKRDIRFSSVPSVFGPAIVLRLLREQEAIKLQELNIDSHSMGYIKKFLHIPHGIVLVTGPTGSGKTTLLYAMLKEINNARIKILTIEDPVEIKLPGIVQVQYNETTGLTFSEAIKSFLRQDPDVILVGEIRDKETLQEAFRASVTGHLVFATLHTNSAIDTILRLMDLGLESYMFSAIEGILAQRLVRRLCDNCKIGVQVSRFLAEGNREFYRYFSDHDFDSTIYFPGPGCNNCNEGYKGRIPVIEVLPMTKRLRAMLLKNATIDEVLEAARTEGFVSLEQKALQYVKAGLVSLPDALQVIKFS